LELSEKKIKNQLGIKCQKYDYFVHNMPRSCNYVKTLFFLFIKNEYYSVQASIFFLSSMEQRSEFVSTTLGGQIIYSVEEAQLPAPIFRTYDNSTQVILYAYRPFSDLTIEERIRPYAS
jgi:hypothetical protein